jgi:predicted TIM-barrel fold metal-dependent hydrolase
MKLSKALKLKNQLAGDVTVLKDRLGKQNSHSAKVPFDYDSQEILRTLRDKIDHLITVKAAIAAANVAQYPRIFRLAELKGLVALLKALDVRHGVFMEGGNYAQSAHEIEYVAQIKKAAVDALVAEMEAEISALQDQLDEFNHTHAVDLTA